MRITPPDHPGGSPPAPPEGGKWLGPVACRHPVKGAVGLPGYQPGGCEKRKIEGVVFRRRSMGRVRGQPFRRNRTFMIGEAAVAVLEREQGLTARQIAERIVPVVHQFRFNNSTLGWIVARTPGIIAVSTSPHKISTYELEEGRTADLPKATQARIEAQLQKFYPPSGDIGN